jgi:hypothetical protein
MLAIWSADAHAELSSSVRVDVTASLYIPSNVPGVPLIQESEVKTVDAPVSTFQTAKAGGNFGSGFASSLLGSGNLQAHSNAQATTVAGSNSHATADASAGIFSSSETYVIEGLWAAKNGGVARIGGAAREHGSGEFSIQVAAGSSVNLRAQAFSGDSTPQDYINSSASLKFIARMLDEPPPPLPGSSEDEPDVLLATGADISDLRSDGRPADTDYTPPAIIAGINLAPIIDSHGRTGSLFFGPSPSGNGGTAQLSTGSLALPPIVVTAYRYQVSDNLFTHFILPFAMPGGHSDLHVEVDGNIVPYTPGTLFDFTAYVPGGIDEFFLSGIDIEEAFQLNELTRFVSGFRFAQNGLADIRIAPADVFVLVPEPANALAAGLFALMIAITRRFRRSTFTLA